MQCRIKPSNLILQLKLEKKKNGDKSNQIFLEYQIFLEGITFIN